MDNEQLTKEEDMHTRTTQTVAPKPTSVLHKGGSRSPNAVTTALKQSLSQLSMRARGAFPCLYGHCSVTPTNQLRCWVRALQQLGLLEPPLLRPLLKQERVLWKDHHRVASWMFEEPNLRVWSTEAKNHQEKSCYWEFQGKKTLA
uniref:Uncharacterized protein n=1 Tax=Knipowitschia caucasica TaxID=637954 RepID=A0AAV2LHP2_KNICA